MTDSLANLKARAEAARDLFEAGRAKLFGKDGERLFSDQEHERRLAALRDARNAAFDAVEAEADAAIQAANAEIERISNGGPVGLLTGGEMAEASARLALIEKDLAGLRGAGLEERLSAVRLGGDRATMGGYLVAARAHRAVNHDGDKAPALLEALSVLEAAITPADHSQKLEDARRTLEGASEIKGLLWLSRRGQRSAYEPRYNVPTML